MVGRFHPRTVGALSLLVLFLAAPAAAQAARTFSELTIGPIHVDHGYTLSVQGGGCDGKHPMVDVVYTKTLKGGSESHSYASTRRQHCHFAPDDSTGSADLRLAGDMAKVEVTFRKNGPANHGRLAHGCTGPPPLTQPGVVTGTIQVSIDGSFFGRVRLERVRASVLRVGFIECKPQPSSQHSLFLSAQFGSAHSGASLGAFRVPGFGRVLSVSTTNKRRSDGVTVSHFISLGGKGFVFAAAGNLDSAHLDAPGGPIQGQLRFTAKPGSTGAARVGTLRGTLKIHFDLVGAQTLNGSAASQVLLARGSSQVSVVGGSGSFTGSFFRPPRSA